MPHHLGMGRHLFLDVAVTDPGVGAALRDGAAFFFFDFFRRSG